MMKTMTNERAAEVVRILGFKKLTVGHVHMIIMASPATAIDHLVHAVATKLDAREAFVDQVDALNTYVSNRLGTAAYAISCLKLTSRERPALEKAFTRAQSMFYGIEF